MLIGVITGIAAAACAVAGYIVWSSRRAEIQKYYDAAYKIIKEDCLNQAISRREVKQEAGQKVMVYLKWKDRQKQGFVFDPAKGVRIGRTPEENEICIREAAVSARHCILYLAGGQLAVQDFQSANGTWIRRGLRKHAVQGAELVYTGDKILVGSLKIKVTVFTFDMAYI